MKKKEIRPIKTASLFLILMLLFSCQSKSRYSIDTEENKIEVKIARLDSALIHFDQHQPYPSALELYEKFPIFFPLYVRNVLDTISLDTLAVSQMLTAFADDDYFQTINRREDTVFRNVSDIEEELSDTYTYIHHYFSEIELPQIYLFVSGFNRSVLFADDMLGVGGDFYLGQDFAPYRSFTYDYLLANMTRKMFAIDVASAVLFRHFIFNGDKNRLIDHLLHRGKVLFLLKTFMPSRTSAEIIGYSPEQWAWAVKYEKQIWRSVIEQKHLFDTDNLLMKKYLNDAPFTSPISQDSPGRLGVFLGIRIMEEYVKNNDVSLPELMQFSDYQAILSASKYNP